jgi:hypothetical protein
MPIGHLAIGRSLRAWPASRTTSVQMRIHIAIERQASASAAYRRAIVPTPRFASPPPRPARCVDLRPLARGRRSHGDPPIVSFLRRSRSSRPRSPNVHLVRELQTKPIHEDPPEFRFRSVRTGSRRRLWFGVELERRGRRERGRRRGRWRSGAGRRYGRSGAGRRYGRSGPGRRYRRSGPRRRYRPSGSGRRYGRSGPRRRYRPSGPRRGGRWPELRPAQRSIRRRDASGATLRGRRHRPV